MSDLSVLSPNGWFNGWLSHGQIYPGYNGNPDNPLTETVTAFSGGTKLNQGFPPGLDPGNQLMLDAYMTYFGSGNVKDNRFDLLSQQALVTNGKSPWQISKDTGQNFRPILTVYMNDASTVESALGLLTDINSSGGTSNGKRMSVNVLTNAALQIGAFLGARIWSANPQAGIKDPASGTLSADDIKALRALRNGNSISGDILLTPDGIGSFVKNYKNGFPGLSIPYNAVNSSTTQLDAFENSVVSPNLVRTSDGQGWQVENLSGQVLKVIPGAVTLAGATYTVQPKMVLIPRPDDPSKGSLVPQLRDPAGKLYSDLPSDNKLWLRLTDDVDARGSLQEALRSLRTVRDTYGSYGVVFPEIFYAADKDFNQFVDTLPGFSPVPGRQLPDLAPVLKGDLSDLLATQTYLAKLFAGPLNVAHVFNPWGAGLIDAAPWYVDGRMFQDGSKLLEGAMTAAEVQKRLATVADQVTAKLVDLGWFKASSYMDYFAMDKYERDELSGAVNANTPPNDFGQYNAYNRNAWINFAYYANQLSQRLRTGPGSATADGKPVAGGGNADLLYYQIPAASLPADLAKGSTAPFVNGLAGPGADLAGLMASRINDAPHFSMAFDTFFGNPDLASQSAFELKFPEIANLTINVIQGSNTTPTAFTLSDYLFSTAANALEDQGPRDPSKGLLSTADGEAKVNTAIVGDLFGILWGGGNSSTPISYSDAQWGASGASWSKGPSVTTTNAPNSLAVVPLGNTVEQLSNWAAADYAGPTGGSEVSVRSLGLRYAAIKTDSSGKLSLALASQAAHHNSLFLYKLKTPSSSPELDAITGTTLAGNTPDARTASTFFQDVITSNVAIAASLSTATAGLGKGVQVASIAVDPNSYYGVLLRSDAGKGSATYSTSYAAAGSWDGTNASDRAVPAAALVDASDLSNAFFGGKVSFVGTRVLGFEDNILASTTDFDYNDVFLGVTGGGSILV